MKTRVPTFVGADPTAPGYAWRRDTDGNLRLSGNSRLLPGQGWRASRGIRPSTAAITDDPYWTRDESGNLRPLFT